MDDFDTLAKSATGQLQASYVAADVARLAPMLASGDQAKVTAAVAELQKWAGGEDSLRKAYAAEWLSNARKALGGMHADHAIAQYGRKVVPGEAMPKGGEGVKARFAAKKPAARMEQGGSADRLDAHHMPSPKIQHGMMAHPRLSDPAGAPAAAMADHAHAAGATLAGKAAKHGFKLGLAAAATIGAGAAAHHHLKDKGMDKSAANEGLEKVFEPGSISRSVALGPLWGHPAAAHYAMARQQQQSSNDDDDDKRKKKACPTCGQPTPAQPGMGKGAANDGLEKNWEGVLGAAANPFDSVKSYAQRQAAATRARHATMQPRKACPTCGQPTPAQPGMGKGAANEGLEKGAWRATSSDEVHPPGRKFRMNQTTGKSEVWDEKATARQAPPARPVARPNFTLYGPPTGGSPSAAERKAAFMKARMAARTGSGGVARAGGRFPWRIAAAAAAGGAVAAGVQAYRNMKSSPGKPAETGAEHHGELSEKARKERSDAAKARWAKHKSAKVSPMLAAGA